MRAPLGRSITATDAGAVAFAGADGVWVGIGGAEGVFGASVLAGAALLSATVLLATGWPLLAAPLAVCALFFAAKAVLS